MPYLGLASGIVFFAFIFMGCAPNLHHVNEKYKNAKINGEELFVFPVQSADIQIKIPEHFKDDFDPPSDFSYEAIMADTLNVLLPKVVQSAAKRSKVLSKSIDIQDEYFDFKPVLNPGTKHMQTLPFNVPKREILQANGISSQYVLVVNKIEFGTEVSSGMVMNSSGGMSSTSSKKIALSLHYLLWDYAASDAVAFGKASGGASANWFITKKDWITIIQRAGEGTIAKSPFYVKPRSTTSTNGL